MLARETMLVKENIQKGTRKNIVRLNVIHSPGTGVMTMILPMPEQRRRQLHCAAEEEEEAVAASAASRHHPTAAAAAAAPGCGKRNIINHSPPDSKITETNECCCYRGERERDGKEK